jgi:hypothetical protein
MVQKRLIIGCKKVAYTHTAKSPIRALCLQSDSIFLLVYSFSKKSHAEQEM